MRQDGLPVRTHANAGERVSHGGTVMTSFRLIRGGRTATSAASAASVSGPGPRRDRDDVRNARWDELLSLAEESWCWRDPESLTALARAVAAMRRDVVHEWNE